MIKHTRLIGICLMFVAVLLVAGCSSAMDKQQAAAEAGIIDLRTHQWRNNELLSLSGLWQLHAGQLLGPDEAMEATGTLVEVPLSWNAHDAQALTGLADGLGAGTYSVTILLPPGEQRLALRVSKISTTYRLWVNGELLGGLGVPGMNREETVPMQYPQVFWLTEANEKLELVMQVANYHHRRGGIWAELLLGTTEAMKEGQMRATAEQLIIFGSLFMIGFYHLGLYALRRQEGFTLYFGLLCLAVAARSSVTGDAFLLQWFPDMPWEGAMKLEYTAFVLSALSAQLYIYQLFPEVASRTIKRASTGFALLLIVFVLLFRALQYSQLLGVFQLYVLLMSLYVLLVVVRACVRRLEGSALVLAGVGVFVLTIWNDMSFYNEWIGVGDLVPVGLFFFIMMQAFIISSRFSGALKKVETVSAEVQELNLYLEERIEERTSELQASNKTLARANRDLARMERSRRHLLTNISHDLRTPMTLIQGYLEAMQDGLIKEPQQRQRYVQLMLSKVDGMNRMIHDLFELSKLEAGQVSFTPESVRLSDWMTYVREHYQHDIEQQGHHFSCLFESDHVSGDETHATPEELYIWMDKFRFNQVLSNLLYNALRHMRRGGELGVVCSYDRQEERVRITVSDTGSGIDPAVLPRIFDRFYKIDAEGHAAEPGSGIGLAIVKELVELHEGTIEVESEPGTGTAFHISLPVNRPDEAASSFHR